MGLVYDVQKGPHWVLLPKKKNQVTAWAVFKTKQKTKKKGASLVAQW